VVRVCSETVGDEKRTGKGVPTGNLDTASSNSVFTLLRQFNRDRGITFLVVFHDESIAAACDRVIEMVSTAA